jgi:predicted  nucleic acid-binding Zn-ribbon protein
MRPVILLAQLNEADLTLDAINARLAEVAAALVEPAALQVARQALARAEAELMHCRAVQQDRELAQKTIAEKLARAEKKLYEGQIRNPKELADLGKDVEQLRRQLSSCEDALLDALIATETASAQIGTCRETLVRLEQEWAGNQTALRAEQARLNARLSAEQTRHIAARRAVPAHLLPLYDALRARRGGRAVSQLDGEACSACGVAASPSKLEAARYGEELTACENCGRLLWEE